MYPYTSRVRSCIASLLVGLLVTAGGFTNAGALDYHRQESLPVPAQITDTVVFLPLVTLPATTVDVIAIDGATMDFYQVSGENETEVRQSLNQNRPGSYDALTEWYFQWTGCRPEGVGVEYTITVTFPELTSSDVPPRALVQEWNRYINALAIHEEGHVDLVLDAVPNFIDTLQTVPCGEINATANAMLAEINAQNEQYDAETDHGATQGATFP